MAKVTGPLLSVGAKGTIAKTQTYASWRGVKYVRQRVIPANPRTANQQMTRNVFTNMNKMWQFAPYQLQEVWNTYAIGKPLTGRNAFIGANVKVLREAADMTDFIGSIGARGGIALDAITASPTANPGEIIVSPTLPPVPTDWTIDAVVAVAFPDQSPTEPFSCVFVGDQANTEPWEVTLTGLPEGQLCVVSAWPVFTRPDGKKAYGPSINATATPASS